ncbi:MAG: CHASE2 domain-containing protein, partial [Casimicrobiaceae bacterium]
MSKSSTRTGSVWRDYRITVVALALATAFALAHFTNGEIELTDGLIYDAALAVAPGRDPGADSKVVVIAIDQGSLGPGRFGAVPRVFLGPYFAVLIDGLFASGAKAVGFDVIFGFAASRSEHVDAGFDRPLIDALAKHRDRTVLARTARTPVADPFMAAMFDPARDDGRDESRNIAYAELSPSSDGVQRWVAARLEAEDAGDLPTFAAVLAEVAGARSMPPEMRLLKPAAPIESLPTYAFADVLACIEHDPKGAAQVFRDKIVVIGSTLPEEDRKRSADRFMRWPSSGPERSATSGCNLKRLGRS